MLLNQFNFCTILSTKTGENVKFLFSFLNIVLFPRQLLLYKFLEKNMNMKTTKIQIPVYDSGSQRKNTRSHHRRPDANIWVAQCITYELSLLGIKLR